MNRFDRFRSAVARAIAPKRAPSGRVAFAGALFDRLSDWALSATRSAAQDLNDLRVLRNRSRDLVNNTPYGQRYSQILVESVVGPNGIQLQAKNTTLDGKLFAKANQAIEDWWKEWGRPENCTVEKRLSWNESLSLGVGNWGADGEILIREYRGPRFGKTGYAIQILDPDLLDEKYNQNAGNGVPLIRQGVEYDDFGAPVAYHLWNRHPQDGNFDQRRISVPADEIIHAFIPRRPGQGRGVPHYAAILTTAKMVAGYHEAEVVAARIESAKMGALEDADSQNPSTRDPNSGTMAAPAEADPGTLLDLRGMNAKLTLWDPQHPGGNVDSFTKIMARLIAVGLGTSYSTLSGDLSDTTFSSAKIGLGPERDHWERFQQFVIVHVCDRVYRGALKMALLNGQVAGIQSQDGAYDAARWAKVSWAVRGFQSPDPLKDIQSDLIEVAAGVNTLTNVAAKRGRDLEEIIAERKAEIDLFTAAGVTSTLPIAAPKGTSTTVDETGGSSSDESGSTPARSLQVA